MKLSNRTIGRLWQALHALDGEPATEKSPGIRYGFTGKVLYDIAKTINHLRGHQEAVQKASDGIVRKHADGKAGLSQSDPAFAACEAEINQLLDAETEVEVRRIKLADLNLEGNKLRPGTLAGLEPMIEE